MTAVTGRIPTRDLVATARARLDAAEAASWPRDRRRDVARPPGPRVAAATALLLSRGAGTLDFMRSVERRYTPLAHTRIAGEHVYLLTSPDVIVSTFVTHGRHTVKGRGLQAARALLGNGLLTSEGAEHRRNRLLVQPAFHRERIAGYADAMVARADSVAESLAGGAAFDVVTTMSALTLAVVGDTLFGADLTGDAVEVADALTAVIDGSGGRLLLGPAGLRIPTPGRRRALTAAARLDAVVARLIDEHRGSPDAGDILSMLVAAREQGEGLTDDQVRDEVMTLVLAGHETTAMALSWAWLLLAGNPDARDWWHEEIDAQYGDGSTPAFADLAALPRTRAVVAESMRLYPPAWIMGRRLLVDVEQEGWLLPAGTLAIASQFALHRSDRWWTAPGRFVPQRWCDGDGGFDESAPGVPRGVWFPFGFGTRRCIGEQFAWTEAALVLATIGRRLQVDRLDTGAVGVAPGVTLRPDGGTSMRARARD